MVDTLRDLNPPSRHFLSRPLALSTHCTPCSALLRPKQSKRTKALMLGISIYSLPAPPCVPPDRLQTGGQETTVGEKFLAISRFCWNAALPNHVVQGFHESWRVIDETKSSGHCELQDKPLLTAGVGKWWRWRPITLPLLCSWARPDLPPFTAPSFTSIHHHICPNELEVDGRERTLWKTNKDFVFSWSPMCGRSFLL